MKKPTIEEAARIAGLHARAVHELTVAGFECVRQFTACDSLRSNESFEIWGGHGKTVFVQFYANGNGVELYKIAGGNSWESFAAHLAGMKGGAS